MTKIRASRWILALALAALAAPCGFAADDEDEVVLYTNADVEKLTPLPTTGTRSTPFDEEAWAFVAEFLDSQRARIDAEREWKLDRDRVEIEEQAPAATTVPYLPLRVPYWTQPYGRSRPVAAPQETMPATPHPMFVERPAVREFVPGLGDASRVPTAKAGD